MPGALGGNPPGLNEFIDFFAQWWTPPEGDELEDPFPVNTRGFSFENYIDDGMAIEWIEVQIAFDQLPADASDNLRITLVSPDGVHSELTDYTIPPNSMDPITPLDEDGEPTDEFPKWVFTTNRHWGERSGGNAVEYNPFFDAYFPRPWSLEFENWSEEDIHVAEIDIFFYGVDYSEVYAAYGPAAPGGRIQGVAGLDLDGDDDYNFTGIVNEMGEFLRDPTEPLMQDGLYFAAGRETAASGATIYVDINKDGLFNDDRHNIVDIDQDGEADFIEPFFVTGTDGNFYFDLPFSLELEDGTYTTYTIRQEPPPGTVLNTNNELFTESYEVTLLPDDPMTPELEHRELEANFLYTPAVITYEGTVFADFNENGVQNSQEPGVGGFVLFIDSNEDGILQYYDINFNDRYDDGVDVPFEPVTISAGDGSYSLSFGPGDRGFNGRDYYTLMLKDRDGWTAIEPESSFYRIYSQSGETISNLDFAMDSELGGIAGVVYHDYDRDGVLDANELTINHWLVYLDLDNDRVPDANEPQQHTNNAGEYAFINVHFGEYRVRAAAQPDWFQTSPDGNGSYLIQLLDDEPYLAGLDFGFGSDATFDFGDLPGPYPTTLDANGPRHPILPNFFLGTRIDGESDGQPDPDAKGDDMVGHSDEDGVVLIDEIAGNAQGVRIEVTANCPGGYLQGWMDLNRDGDWDDAGERVFEDVLLDQGVNLLTLDFPWYVEPGPIYSRFRFAEQGIDSYTGAALGGEVEDYIFEAGEALPPSYANGNFNQDSMVDGQDLAIWEAGFGTVQDAEPSQGDADDDGDIDGNDFLAWQLGLTAGGGGGGGSAAAESEPASGGGKSGILARNTGNGSVAAANEEGLNVYWAVPSYGTQPLANGTTVRSSAARPASLLADANGTESAAINHAVRFDLALDELITIQPAETGSGPRIVQPIQVEQVASDRLPVAAERNPHDLAIHEVFGDQTLRRRANRDTPLQIPATKRLPAELDSEIKKSMLLFEF